MEGLKELLDEYIANIYEARTRIKPNVALCEYGDDIIDAIERNADRLFRIKTRNMTILKDHVFGLLEEPTLLTHEQVNIFFDAANQLYGKTNNYDAPMAYIIHNALVKYARVHNDTDMLIRELYFCGILLFEMNMTPNSLGIKLFNRQVVDCFGEVSTYCDKLGDFESSETHSYIIRARCNSSLGLQTNALLSDAILYPIDYDEVKEAAMIRKKDIEFLCDEKTRALAPDLPWDTFIRTLHLNQTTLISAFRANKLPEMKELAFASAKYLYNIEIAKNPDEYAMPARIMYLYYALGYEAGRFTISEFLEHIIALVRHADINDYSENGQFMNYFIVTYAVFYWTHRSNCDPKYIDSIEKCSERVQKYMEAIPPLNNVRHITELLRSSIRYSFSARYDNTEHFLLWHLIAFHKPTYVHSQMVAELTRRLCAALIDNAPEKLIGVLQKFSAKEIVASRDEIEELAYRAGLYHDIGKVTLIDVVSMYGRNLTWEEFQLIRCHPYAGYITLAGLEQTKRIATAALGHHVWYNGRGGYPDIYASVKTDIAPIIDIISIADSIEAATDDIGRCYSYVKSYSELKAEVLDQSGTRYAPYAAKLLLIPEVESDTIKILNSERRNIYKRVYESKPEK